MGHQYANYLVGGGWKSVDCRTNNKLIAIENAPAGVCKQCSEQYYTARVAKAMEKISIQDTSLERVVFLNAGVG